MLHVKICRCPLHRGVDSLLRVSALLRMDHRLSDESADKLEQIIAESIPPAPSKAFVCGFCGAVMPLPPALRTCCKQGYDADRPNQKSTHNG